MPLIHIPKDARKGMPPCGECHVSPGETCDICGASLPAESPNDVVGHKTMADGSHEPLYRWEGDALSAMVAANDQRRASLMPTEQSAIDILFDAWVRLKDFGWREAIYCPKDGSSFIVIEPGSTGQHPCHYEGEWPNGSWTDGDSTLRPCLYKARPRTSAD